MRIERERKMYSLLRDELKKYNEARGPIKVAVVGIGFIGGGVIIEMSRMEEAAYFPSVILYRNEEKLKKVISQCDREYGYKVCETREAVIAAQEKGLIAAVTAIDLIFDADIDIVMDFTGDCFLGAELALKSIENRINICISPELDSAVGAYLAKLAKENDVICSGFSGDEPGELANLVSYVKLAKFEIISAGKFKRYNNRYANPDSVKKWADLYQQNPIKISSFADGTKMNIEMGLVANSLGMSVDTSGMHCPESDLENIVNVIGLKEDGGILDRTNVVEIVKGAEPSGGVFVIGRTTNKKLVEDLKYYKMGNGPYYLFYKPYHLCAFEMLIGAAKIHLFRSPVVCAQEHKSCDVVIYAKKDLKKGEVLEEIGGFSFYGLLENYQDIEDLNHLPVSVAPGCVLNKAIKKDQVITLNDVETIKDSTLWEMIKIQYGYQMDEEYLLMEG
jgi:predicted homoserine dehydrogenase-like protein